MSMFDGLALLIAAAGGASEPPPTPGAHRLAELNWQTCLEDRALRITIKALDQRGPMPHPDAVLAACAAQEEEVRRALARNGQGAEIERLRDEAESRVREAIATTYRRHNFD